MKKKILIITTALVVVLGTSAAGWYFRFYKPKQDLQAQQAADERIVLGMTLQQYKYIFGGDENVYKKCQQITAVKKDGIFTTQDIERRGRDCECTVVSVKRQIFQVMSETYNDAMRGSFNESEFKKGMANLKEHGDMLIEIALDGCQMDK